MGYGYTLKMPPHQPPPAAALPQAALPQAALDGPARTEAGAADLPAEASAGIGMMLLLTVANFGFATCVTMLGPLLVGMSEDLQVSIGEIGLLSAAMAISWAIAAPFAGLLSDRFGRRPMIVLALGGLGAVTLGAGLASNYAVLLMMRVLAGVFGGFGPACIMAAAADQFPPKRRGMAMSCVNLSFSAAAIAGVPVIGAIGGTFGWRWGFAACGLLLLATCAFVRLTFPSTGAAGAGGSSLRGYWRVLVLPGLGSIMAANMLERVLFNVGSLYLPSFLMLSYGLDAVEVAPALTLVAIGSIIGTLGGGWLSDRLPRGLTFIVAQLTAGVIGLVVFSQPVGVALSMIGGMLFILANASSRAGLLALGSDLSVERRGAILGLVSLTNQGGIILGSSIGGLALGLGGYSAISATMLLVGVLAAVMALPLLKRE